MGNRIKSARFMLLQQIIDPSFAGIVRGKGEAPFAEAAVQIAEVLSCGARIFLRLQPFVLWPDGKLERPGGCGHQLKQSGSAGRTARGGIERRLYFGYPHQFRWCSFGDKNFLESRDVGLRQAGQWALDELFVPEGTLNLG